MFDHRLGLALHKSVGEIRALPYPEYHAWELFHLLEPWGWQEDEYHFAALLAMLYNANRGKGKVKPLKEFMRDMQAEVLKQLAEAPDLSELPLEEQKKILIQQIKKDFGIGD